MGTLEIAGRAMQLREAATEAALLVDLAQLPF